MLGLRWSDVASERGELRIERQVKRLHGRWYLEAIKTGERCESTIRRPEVAVDMDGPTPDSYLYTYSATYVRLRTLRIWFRIGGRT